MDIKLKLINGGKVPEFKTAGAACADTYARLSKPTWVWLFPKLIPLGFAVELPSETEMIVRGRSGNGKKGHYIVHGTVDEDFRGEVSACVWSILPFRVKDGFRIAQVAIRPAPKVSFNTVSELSETERGSGGFGSTGSR